MGGKGIHVSPIPRPEISLNVVPEALSIISLVRAFRAQYAQNGDIKDLSATNDLHP